MSGYKYELFIGLNDKDTKTQLKDKWTAKKIICESLNQFFDCYSLSELTGYYQGVEELTIKVTFINANPDEVDFLTDEIMLRQVIKELKEKLNQECILMTKQELTAQLV